MQAVRTALLHVCIRRCHLRYKHVKYQRRRQGSDRDGGDDGDNCDGGNCDGGGANECGDDGNGGQSYIIFVHIDCTSYICVQIFCNTSVAPCSSLSRRWFSGGGGRLPDTWYRAYNMCTVPCTTAFAQTVRYTLGARFANTATMFRRRR